MKAIVCEMCGSNDLIKREGLYVCQNCGTKYTVEEAKNLLVEVSDKVEIDTPNDTNNANDNTVVNDTNQHNNAVESPNSTTLIGGLVLLLFIIGYFLFSSSSPKSTPTSSTKNAVSNKVRTDSLMNGDQEEAIRRLLGEPDEVTESHIDNKTTTRRYSYDGLYITARNGIVDYINKDLQVINDAPIRRRDSFTKVRWYRGAPLREEKVVVEKNDVDVRPLNLYEYPDYVIITNCPEFKKQREIVLGFVPKGGFNITTTSIGIREVTFTTAVNMDGEIPLKVTDSNNAPATVNLPAVVQNPANSNSSQNENFIHKAGQTITIKGTDVNMRESYSRSSNVIGVFETGEKVEYLGEQFIRQDGIWMNVKRKNGMTGWVFGAYVKEMYAETNGQSTNNTTQEAKDVFVEHWKYENVDVYVVDKSITSGTSGTDKFFKVKVKQVQNGKLIKSNEWSFSQYRGEWRYKTDEMKGNTSTVFNNKIFEYCMNQLGWAYNKKDGYYR